MKKYGVPYKGSKDKIADWIIDLLPPCGTFVDLFAGGCAMTHAALLSDKWEKTICNDADPRGIHLFIDSVHGKYSVEKCPQWIDRDTFNLLKNSDPYIALCWSFGNNMRNYLYGEEIEQYKKCIWELCFASTVYERNLKYKKCASAFRDIKKRDSCDGRLQSLESLRTLEGLKSLNTDGLSIFDCDYKNVDIPSNSIVYCDPPYQNTDGYAIGIEHDDFVRWCNAQAAPVYVSEYKTSGLHMIAEHSKNSTLSAAANNKVVERIYCNDVGLKLFRKQRNL